MREFAQRLGISTDLLVEMCRNLGIDAPSPSSQLSPVDCDVVLLAPVGSALRADPSSEVGENTERVEQDVVPAYSFEEWLLDQQPGLQQANWSPAKDDRVLRDLFESQYTIAAEQVFELSATEDWVSEVLARAESLSEHLRLAPMWPATFEMANLSIRIWYRADRVLGWVGKDLEGVPVSFRIRDWEVFAPETNDGLIAGGLAVSWFLDCGLGVPRSSSASSRSASEGLKVRVCVR